MMESLQIYGNAQAKRIFSRALESGRIGHAYLIYGQAGLGKQTVARWFAAAVLCKGEKKPCGVCSSCKKAAADSHPDLIVENGTGGGKNSFHADVVRALRTDAYIRPNDGERKVYLLLGVDAMSPTAANALLKILEEPPAGVVFLLTAENRNSVPETVLSRCVPVPVHPVTEDECRAALETYAQKRAEAQEKATDWTPEQIAYAAQASGGNIGRALDMLEGLRGAADGMLAQNIAAALTERFSYERLAAAAPLARDRKRAIAVLDEIALIFRDALAIKCGSETRLSCGEAQATRLAGQFTAERLYAGIEKIGKAQKNLDRNAGVELTLTWLCTQL